MAYWFEWKLQFLPKSQHEIALRCAETKRCLPRLDLLLTMPKWATKQCQFVIFYSLFLFFY